ncbi:MAG: LLM class flavin-dependent oxidoreductase [Burkholderiales bacterium]
MKFGVLDQSPIVSGHTPAEAIHETIALARLADRLGFHRYWLAEHHALGALADPCPEVLLARIGAETKRIRVGTGGVLLPHYSSLKVAETFRMLEALHPGRIDLGIGRAPGGDMRTARSLREDGFADAAQFPVQIRDLIGFLEGSLPADHPYAKVRVQPTGKSVPPIWLLGSSDYSGALAAHIGARFAFAHFINPQGGDAVMHAYKKDFQPSTRLPRPEGLACVSVICADSNEEADRLAISMDLRRIFMATGVEAPIPTVEEARAYPWTDHERAYAAQQRPRLIHGDPETVRDGLLRLAARYDVDELMLLTITGDYPSRRRSYELIAEAFDLGSTERSNASPANVAA